jgi:hypothetical protein
MMHLLSYLSTRTGAALKSPSIVRAPERHGICVWKRRANGVSVVFVGEGGTVEFAPSPLLIHKQLTLHGSWVCSIGQMEDLVELLVRWNLHP